MAIEVVNNYIGVKDVVGHKMTLGDYNKLRGWELPANEEKDTAGYLVEYIGNPPNHPDYNNFISWCPADVFEDNNTKVGPDESDYMSFSLALMLLKDGKAVSREGWNGKRQFVQMVKPGYYDIGCSLAKGTKLQSFLALTNSNNSFFQPGWVPSISDLLANDWFLADHFKD